jgi:hypothetical protein
MPKKTTSPQIHTDQNWSCVHQSGKSQIEAINAANGNREILAEILPGAGHSAEAVAEFIVRTVNELEQCKNMMSAMEAALETCLESDGLTWAAEQDADKVLRSLKNQKAIY